MLYTLRLYALSSSFCFASMLLGLASLHSFKQCFKYPKEEKREFGQNITKYKTTAKQKKKGASEITLDDSIGVE